MAWKVIFLESKGATWGGKRGRGRLDSCGIRDGRDVKGYLILPICPMIQVGKYADDKITSQLNGREGIKAQLNKFSDILLR